MYLLFSYRIGIYKLIYIFNLTLITFIGKVDGSPAPYLSLEGGRKKTLELMEHSLMVAFPFFPAICIVVYAQVL